MIAVEQSDTIGALMVLAVVVGILVIDKAVDRARRSCTPLQRPGAASLPDDTRHVRRVEAGPVAAADPTYRESVAGPPPRFQSAAAAISAVTAPGPYNRGAVRK